ncbi:hypothetical protein [Thiothrix lacustris]|uniref:hypothetical protein n=1 Tax=Thiothrix lacustris TaxID=525917 RepID=UPI0012EB43F2|nr:hypothetical protein [Thiothrix lacustris]WMP17244.1 hypothetical protein RCS87_17945 [Thiothrix lacustris]
MILSFFDGLRVKKTGGFFSVHKPLLLLVALARCFHKKERLVSFLSYENELAVFRDYFDDFSVQYPFGRLVNDGLWEVEDYDELIKSSSGDISRTELIQRNIKGGFTLEVYRNLLIDDGLTLRMADLLLGRYFAPELHQGLRAAVGLPNAGHTTTHNTLYGVKKDMGTVSDLPEPVMAKENDRINDGNRMGVNLNLFDMIAVLKPKNKDHQNGFIGYLNSLHNLSADGSNALAESQALSSYFTDLYVAFPLADTVKDALTSGEDKVIILTGHAGDGKSTVALDVFKHLHGYAPDQPLRHKLKEREVVRSGDREISIIKDMSELSAQDRLKWLDEAFGKPGSCLIISNTGPLLDSLSEFVKNHGIADVAWVENEVLKKLDTPYKEAELTTHTLRLGDTTKPLVILNMTRLNNVDSGAKVLEKMLLHPGWSECRGCDVEESCPLRKNRQALQQRDVVERVRWVYQRLTAYEQRLTLRHIVAHLAYSVTGGLDCTKARHYAYDTQTSNGEVNTGLENHLFSESFFGYKSGEVDEKAGALKAIELIRRLEFGSPFAVDFERKLIADDDTAWVGLPPALAPVVKRWRNYSREAAGVRWRFALRRMAYLYGQQPVEQSEQKGFHAFLDNFLQAPKLRQFDDWQRNGALELSHSEQRAFKANILNVLLEVYSGFSAGQFKDSNNRLYLTLRRPDKAVVQPTQMVIASFNTNDFSVGYDKDQQQPFLRYRDAKLMLSLPLLDYIQTCSIGSLGNQLVPIHLAQLEWFRSRLLKVAEQETSNNDEFIVLSAGVDGTVKTNKFYIDRDKNRLEFA